MRRRGFSYHGAPRRRRRPLGGRRTLTAVFERCAELLLRRAEVRRSCRGGYTRRTRIDTQRRHCQRQSHCRARAVKPDKRYAEISRAERRAAALAEQIARHEHIYIGGGHAGFFNSLHHGAMLKRALRLLPCLFAECAVGYNFIETPAERPVPLFAADYRGGCDYPRTAAEFQRIFSNSLCHRFTPLS